MLLNPYNGCGVGCFFCYARALPGYFQKFHSTRTVFVFQNFPEQVSRQLDRCQIAFCGYLSPVADPFQRVNKRYRLSEKTAREFIQRNIPIEFVTKEKIPPEIIAMISGHPHCFGQISILTPHEALRHSIIPHGAKTNELFGNLKCLAKKDLFSVCRIDPILPYITDAADDLALLVRRARENGAQHIIASVLDIPVPLKEFFFQRIEALFGRDMSIRYRLLYSERYNSFQAETSYRKKTFLTLRQICDSFGITFGLCMEFEKDGLTLKGLNRSFGSSFNCEGIDIPVYVRKGNFFEPMAGCKGNCLCCQNYICGIERLKEGLPLTFRDYARSY